MTYQDTFPTRLAEFYDFMVNFGYQGTGGIEYFKPPFPGFLFNSL
jgi:hypothetical protein